MAKAAEIEVNPFEPYAIAAARVVRVRADELFEHSENVLDTSDIERVHDMRVASRRLRAVLEIFEPCFPQGDFKTVLRDVKALADALGERRDPDVHIEDMEEFESARAGGGPAGHRGAGRAAARTAGARQRHAGRRARARPRVRPARAPALARRRRRGADRVKAKRVKGLDPEAPLADNAERIVRVRLDELTSFMPKATDPDEVVALHDMRIAAKRLRYILEVTGDVLRPVRRATP